MPVKTTRRKLGAERSHLTERPTRRESKRVSVLVLVICGCLIILGGVGVLVWQLTFHTNAPAFRPRRPPLAVRQRKQPTACTGAREPVDVIQQQTAQGLHLTVAQLQAQALTGKTIAQIATAQGLTAAQLRDVEIQALHVANNRWLSMGALRSKMSRTTCNVTSAHQLYGRGVYCLVWGSSVNGAGRTGRFPPCVWRAYR